MELFIENNAVVLFQGDSVTDAEHNREDDSDLGRGYAMITAAWFSALYPGKAVRFLNRGIGGDRVRDLQERWKRDCLPIAPTWVSILIGVNDTWRRFDSNEITTPQEFEASYRAILEDTVRFTEARLILCEPFLLPVLDGQADWRSDLDPKIEITRQLAREFGTICLPLDDIFTQAAKLRPAVFWLRDGVHPTAAGHALIAQNWLKAVGAL
ncbi:MAG: SGNH/GDSL hydrolase family protein [Chloroflexota bacterium]